MERRPRSVRPDGVAAGARIMLAVVTLMSLACVGDGGVAQPRGGVPASGSGSGSGSGSATAAAAGLGTVGADGATTAQAALPGARPNGTDLLRTTQLPPGELLTMWASPIYVVNVMSDVPEPGSFNAAMADACRRAYASYLQSAMAPSDGSQELNNGFFQWQIETGFTQKVLDRMPEFRLLNYYVSEAVRRYVAFNALSPAIARMSVFWWTSMHKDGSFHKAHTHGDSTLSGIYYARVPPGAGALFFEDPRGGGGGGSGRPPFGEGGTFTHFPREGDIVLFPSWLVHQVERTRGFEDRISFSFNLGQAGWLRTSDVSFKYDDPRHRLRRGWPAPATAPATAAP